MSFFRDLGAAIREGMDDLLHAPPQRDGVDEVLSLLESDLAEARSELEVALRDEQRLKSRMDTERRDAERLRERAQQAVDAGNDDLGRDLVRRRRRAIRGVEILERQWSEHQELIAMLERHIDELEDKLQELRLRSDFLRTRQRVTALRERYERYRREFGLDPPPLDDSDDELDARIRAEVIEREVLDEVDAEADAALEDEAAEVGRLEPDDRERPLPEPTLGRAEVPRDESDEPRPRRRRRERAELVEYRSPWDRPSRDLTIERERMLSEIERRYRDADDADIEDELRRMKGGPAAPPAPAPEPAPAAEGDDGSGGAA